jgi:hypothetical protein
MRNENSPINAFGSSITIGFGILWTVFAYSITKSAEFPFSLFPLFGVLFVISGIGRLLYDLNVTKSPGVFSSFSKKDEINSSDKINNHSFHLNTTKMDLPQNSADNYCPYCQRKIEADFEFCPKCGKDLPQ